MADHPAWELAKLTISAGLGGGVAVLLQQLLPRVRLTVALRADARGALRMIDAHVCQFRAAAGVAGEIEGVIAAKSIVTFELITQLPAGWIITAPGPDLLGHAERFDDPEASAVMKYLHFWNVVVTLEQRYRASLEEVLKMLSLSGELSDAARAVLRERICRVRDAACALVSQAELLRAQAEHFHNGEIRALTPHEEELAQRRVESG